MAESTEELEPLFDYHRVQPFDVVCLDDDCSDSSPAFSPKRRKLSYTAVETLDKNEKFIEVVDCEDKEEDDWLPPPPKVSADTLKLGEDSTIKELRLKKQELASFAKSAEDVFRAVEQSVKRDFNTSSVQLAIESAADQLSKPPCERAKIVISIQEKEGIKQFRVYKDDKFERLFKMYAEKSKLELQKLVFCFDGDKISSTATPDGLGMEDDDIIEVHMKSN
ncbi:putative small ubiquitin-related modifier 8 [Camellia lanceoleosa]|uniref:Small ubiquitin-related modifier 8 n=2 Tax=Camellia lanceoleosa TaxID=1840588 RepID=A0ACC0G9F0_9ERIC|nr:putative small ubiquitin-related modifier 8 [Camellia lanceoleosa]KAI7998799.1 putative small ubiquitin-related modifier 8 [Camellia lanceoleosa]